MIRTLLPSVFFAAALTMAGCSGGSADADNPQLGQAVQTPEDSSSQVVIYPGGLPQVVDPPTVSNLDIIDETDESRAKEIYAWAASFATFSFNDATFQSMDVAKGNGIFAIADFLTDEGLNIAKAHFGQYVEQGDYEDWDTALTYLSNRGLVTILPTRYEAVNQPAFDQIEFGQASIQSAGQNKGLETYKVTIPFSARLLFTEGTDPQVMQTRVTRNFALWIVDTGNSDRPFLVDSWDENQLSWTAAEPAS